MIQLDNKIGLVIDKSTMLNKTSSLIVYICKWNGLTQKFIFGLSKNFTVLLPEECFNLLWTAFILLQ